MSSERYANEAALDPPPESSWGKLLALVPRGSRVLDVGCGRGTFAAALRRRLGCHVTGLERDPAYADDARDRCDDLLVGDAAELLTRPVLEARFDVVIAADVLEHLIDPGAVLRMLRRVLAPGGLLLASVPNVTHASIVAELALGRFPRRKEGLLDDTHIQFYGSGEVLDLFERSGFVASLTDRVVLQPCNTEFNTDMDALPDGVVEYLARNAHATTYQFIVRAVPREWATSEDTKPAPTPSAASLMAGRKRWVEDGSPCAHGKPAPRLRMAARLALSRARRMRVIYVTARNDAPFRYRCVHGAAQLRDSGVVANIEHVDAPDLLERVPSYSLVVLFRLPWSERVARVVESARRSGAAVAFETDDLVFDPAVEPLMPFLARLDPEEVEVYRRTFVDLGRTLDAADFCIVPTETLARSARARGKPAVVHPNLLSRDDVAIARVVAPLRRALSRRPIVAYLSGSNTHDGDLASVDEAIAEVMRRRPELSLLLGGYIQVPPALAALSGRILRVQYLDHRLCPWVIARCRAVFAPIEALNDFTNSKSPLKVFEAGVVGVPSVVSPTLPYRAAVEQGASGFVATTRNEWQEAIDALCDARRSRHMGRAAREIALSEYSSDAWRGVLAHRLSEHDGRSSRAPPPEKALEPARLRDRWRVVRRSARLMLGLPASRAAIPPRQHELLARAGRDGRS